jgi:hypothetical protein
MSVPRSLCRRRRPPSPRGNRILGVQINFLLSCKDQNLSIKVRELYLRAADAAVARLQIPQARSPSLKLKSQSPSRKSLVRSFANNHVARFAPKARRIISSDFSASLAETRKECSAEYDPCQKSPCVNASVFGDYVPPAPLVQIVLEALNVSTQRDPYKRTDVDVRT